MRRALLALLGTCTLGTGCAVGPDFHSPAAPTEPGYTAAGANATAVAGGTSQRFVEADLATAHWWRMLQCSALDAIVERALSGNPGLEAARATVRKSQDSLRAGYGIFFPQVDARASASRQLYNPAPGVLPSSTFNLFSLSGTVSYALDLWGGARRGLEALGATVDSERYTLAGTYVMLTSNVVDAVIAQAAYRDEVAVTKAAVALLREQVRIASAQASAGMVPLSNVLSLRSQVATTEAALPALEQKIDQADNLLAALSGTTPLNWASPPVAVDDFMLPEEVPLSLPSRLVRQRPDVLVAEAELHATNAQIGVATAAMLPNFTLSAGLGANNRTPGDLFAASSPFWSLGAGLTQPIFHGGALYYQRKAAIDARDAAAAIYRQTVLGAFQQVADTLRGLSHDADAVKADTEAVETAEKAMLLIQANYQAGIATYLQVLVVDGQYLQTKIGLIQANAQRLQDTVALYVALGGGWWILEGRDSPLEVDGRRP